MNLNYLDTYSSNVMTVKFVTLTPSNVMTADVTQAKSIGESITSASVLFENMLRWRRVQYVSYPDSISS